jgi:hypothetical protein
MEKELLLRILVNQCVLFEKIEDLSDKLIKNKSNFRSEDSVLNDFIKESERFRKIVEKTLKQ